MSTLAIAALVLVCAWLGVLTFVVMLLVRQVGLLSVRLSMATQTTSLDDDGPEIGSSLPEDVAEVMPEGEPSYLLLISAGCEPCRELVADLATQRFEQGVVALVPGHQEQAGELAALLPPGIKVVLDPEATQLAESMDLESTPFALEVERGTVTRKVHLYGGAAALIEFMESGGALAQKRSLVDLTEKEALEGR
ncbi:MAG: hypothetical protein M3317_08710 [Actinomycetota bacterium]|nr:hypothetical protein [Actinomycetota bacterium]